MAMGIHTHGGRRSGARRRAPMAEINVTPLVDVMLVLLIIFMVTAPLLSAGVPIDLPESRANALGQDATQLDVAIDSEGFIFIAAEPVDVGGFPAALAQQPRMADGSLPPVTLRADRQLDYGRVMAVMGELNRAGYSQISLVTAGSASAP